MSWQRLPALGSLRAFEAAARLSSFKEAAAELSVTPAAVSQQIRALEEDLGVKLFDRAVRSVSLTDAGRRLQPALTASFISIRDAVDSVRPQAHRSLCVEASGPIISKWLLPRLHRFSDRNPDLAVTFRSSSEVTGFGADGPDVALRFTPSPSPGLYARKICEEFLLPLASPELVKRLDLRTPVDMARAPLLHDTSPEVFGPMPDWPAWFAKTGLCPAEAQRGVRFDPHDADHAIDAAANGAGVVLGRRFLALSDLLAGRLVCPFGPSLPTHANYFVMCKHGDETRPEIAAFMAWMCDETSMIADYAGSDAPLV